MHGAFRETVLCKTLLLLCRNNKCLCFSAGLESAHHPFTAPMEKDAELVYTTPDQVGESTSQINSIKCHRNKDYISN